MLWADGSTSDVRIILLTLLTGAIGAAGQYLWGQWRELRKESRAERKEEEKTILERQDAYIARLERQVESERAEGVKKAVEIMGHVHKANRCEIRVAKLKSALREAYAVIDRAKLSCEKFVDDEDSDFGQGSTVHAPLPPDAPK